MAHNESVLVEQFGVWGEHPSHPARDWQHEVADGDTRLGYWAWVAAQLDNADT
ncbi:hypothetical protein [Rhodococcus qingshengii]|uniref:hypothetical protein n=1 Tax=Rhodococcus qingshengii TaxID=334542 RepID=UPI00287F7C4A|nr:hypothetical protein [Rhodococcus qingshengii]